MERWQLLILQIIAVFCTYLITSTTFVSALQVRILTSTGQEITGSIANFSDLIEETFSFPYQQNYQYAQIQLSSKNPAGLIKKIYLFRCKDLSPVECIKNGIKPVISTNSGSSDMTFDETYRWDDVSSNNVGNFITMVKLDLGGKEIWTGSLDKITKTGVRNFYHVFYDADGLDLYLKSGVSADAVKSYIESYNAIPSDNMNRSVFNTVDGSSVSKLYDLYGSKDKIDPTGTGVPSFNSANLTGNAFNRSLGAFDFVFAGDGKISNPVVFNSAGAGTTPVTGGARLVIDSWSPQLVTCGSSDVIQVDLHAENATMGYFQTYYYAIGGTRAGDGTMTCSIVNPTTSLYSYRCLIPVSNFPVCNAPGTATINIYFNYTGGALLSAGFPVTLKAPLPRLVVASLSPSPFDCGIDKWLTANLQVSNPSGESLKKYYAFDGRNFNELKNCTGSGGSYACSINSTTICQLLQENLELTFKFVYGSTELLSLPANVIVTFPPPSLGIDTVTPQQVVSGNTTSVNVLLHVNYPDFITYSENSFNYKYLSKDFAPAKCSLENSFSNIKYYKCTVSLEIPDGRQGTETLSFRLDGYRDGSLKQLTANSFFTILPPPPGPSLSIISASPSSLSCVLNPSLSVSARVDNILGTPQTHYSVDGGKTYKPLVCTPRGSIYTCTITKEDLCGLMSSSLTLLLKFVYPDREIISNTQNININLPEPHMQVYSIAPDTLPIGEKTGATVNLFVQYPQMVSANPVFLYSYLDKTNQKMTCTKVSSTSNRDFYECANTQFDIPDSYSKPTLPVLFMIQGTTISFPILIPVAEVVSTNPWLEIDSTTPSRIEVPQGNETLALFYVAVHNAEENKLKHQATLIPNSWITAGTCTETSVQYNFNCTVTIKALKTAKVGANPVSLTLRMTDKKTYDVSNTTNVYVLPEEATMDIQSVNPETLYCEGQKQTNPDTVKVTASTKNLAAYTVLDEKISFNGETLVHTARYCTQQAQNINCNIPSDKLLEKAKCGSRDLAPGGGTHYYQFNLTFLVKAGDVQAMISGFSDIAIVARPLEPYLEISDNAVVDGLLQSKINCLGSQTIKLGHSDPDYVRIQYADLLHPEPKGDDLKWSFRLDAQDDKGKLTKGMGVSPEANATVCKLKGYQRVEAHRIEDYECSLYVDYKLFQRCAAGEGDILLTAASNTGKKAEGKIDVNVIKDDSRYQFDFDIITKPMRDIDCQIQSYGRGAQCSLASYSNQNVTIRVYNNNEAVGMADLNLYDFDVKFGKRDVLVSVNERSLGNCRKDSTESDKYFCPFQIDPTIKLPSTDEYEVTKNSTQADFPTLSLGPLNITIYVKYADGLEQKALSKLDGTMTIHPKKTDSMINAEKMLEKMRKTFDSFIGIFKWITLILSFCAVCVAGNAVVDSVKKTIEKAKAGAIKGLPGGGGTAGSACTTDTDCRPGVPALRCDKSSGYLCSCKSGTRPGSCKTTSSGGAAGGTSNECIFGTFKTYDDCMKEFPDASYCNSCLLGAASGGTPGGTQGGDGCIYGKFKNSDDCFLKLSFVDFSYCNSCLETETVSSSQLVQHPENYIKPGYLEDFKNCAACMERNKVGSGGFCWLKPAQRCDVCLSQGIQLRSLNQCYDEYKIDNAPSFTGTITGTSPSITGAQTAAGAAAKAASSGSSSDAAGIIGSLAVAVGLMLTAMYMMGMMSGDIDKEKNDIMENMKKGIKWGVVTCVLPRIVGEIGGWIAKKESGGKTTGWTTGFKGVASFGSAMGDTCKMLLGLMPMIMNFIQFYIGYLQFKTCMEMVEMQAEAGAIATGSASGPYQEAYQAQASAQTAMSMTSSMMGCFSQFMSSLQTLTNSMAYMGSYMGTMGGTQTFVKYSLGGITKSEGDTLCGTATFQVQANLCKGSVLMQSIVITGEGCNTPPCQGNCNYNMPMMQSYGAYPQMGGYGYTGGYGYGNIGTSAPIVCNLPLEGCKDGTTITVTATGAGDTQTASFKYKKNCAGGGLGPGEICSGEGLSTCKQGLGLECCHASAQDVNTLTKRCTVGACNCLKGDRKTYGTCSNAKTNNGCEESAFCPTNYKYCC